MMKYLISPSRASKLFHILFKNFQMGFNNTLLSLYGTSVLVKVSILSYFFCLIPILEAAQTVKTIYSIELHTNRYLPLRSLPTQQILTSTRSGFGSLPAKSQTCLTEIKSKAQLFKQRDLVANKCYLLLLLIQ